MILLDLLVKIDGLIKLKTMHQNNAIVYKNLLIDIITDNNIPDEMKDKIKSLLKQ